MYSNDKSAVKIDNKLTKSFNYHAGVKQGCMLSPTFFNFYLSDLPKFLNTASSTDIMLSDKYINRLLYADDLVIFSRSAKSLQIILFKLETGVRLFPDCQNVSGIGLLHKKACVFCLLHQFDMQTLM